MFTLKFTVKLEGRFEDGSLNGNVKYPGKQFPSTSNLLTDAKFWKTKRGAENNAEKFRKLGWDAAVLQIKAKALVKVYLCDPDPNLPNIPLGEIEVVDSDDAWKKMICPLRENGNWPDERYTCFGISVIGEPKTLIARELKD